MGMTHCSLCGVAVSESVVAGFASGGEVRYHCPRCRPPCDMSATAEPARFAEGRPQNLAAAALSAVELIEWITARIELPDQFKRLCFQRVRDITYHLTPCISPPKFAEDDSTDKRQAKPWQDLGGEG